MSLRISALILSISLAFQAVSAQTQLKRTASDRENYDEFGTSVSIRGDYAIVGVPYEDSTSNSKATNVGSAYIFYRDQTSSNNWGKQAKLNASDGESSDNFGLSVAISGDYVAIGAPNEDPGNLSSAGAAYVFVRSGTSWSQQAKLTASDSAAGDQFGSAVAVSGDYAVVGVPYDDDKGTSSGSAYVFKRVGSIWTQVKKLTADDGASGDEFGRSVAIEGDYIVIGSPFDEDDGYRSGSIYIFYRNQGGTDNWGQQAKITASDASSYDYFGNAVSISDPYVVVGAYGDGPGSAYIFLRSGITWGQQAKLTSSDGASSDYFGYSVAISDSFVAVGAHQDDDKGTNSGSAYVFKRSDTTWSQHNKFLATDGVAYDRFGWSVSVGGTSLIIGAPYNETQKGASYVYPKLPPATPKNLTASPGSQQVTLKWSPNTESDFQRYRIYGGTSANPTTQVDSTAGGINDSTKTLTGLTNETTYYYRITAVATDGRESGYSNEVSVVASQFIDISAGLVGVYEGSVAWGDYDNDGDLDILLTGYTGSVRTSKIYQNTNGSFTDINAGLTGVYYSSVAWGDYDNDGDLDVLLAGDSGSGYVTKVYRNDNGVFSDISAGLPGVRQGSVAWGDYNNDGDLDILLTGDSGYPNYRISKVYRNDSAIFTGVSAGLTGVQESSVAWGDYDNDGDLDILLAGNRGTSLYDTTKVYKNTNGIFSSVSASVTGIEDGTVSWGDYDDDGDLDILVTGWSGSTYTGRVYRNDNGTFTNIGAGITGVSSSSAAWGDYDNDGDLDIILSGQSSSGYVSKVFKNTSGVFSDIGAALTLPQVRYSSVAWGDYDADGDLDVLVTGYVSFGNYVSKVYRNDVATANTAPTAPAGLASTVSAGSATLSWDKSTDTGTAQNGLTYNLRVGTSTGAVDVVSPMAGTAGQRRVPALGNVNHNTTWAVRGLTDGTYYWSVQAIDHGFMGSPFSSEGSFSVDIAPTSPTGLTATSGDQQITLTWNQNSEADVQRYRIFRDTTSPATTFIDSVVASSLPDTFYVDAGLTDGQTYYYRLTVVDNAGHESGYSSEIEAIPGLKIAQLLSNAPGTASPGGYSGGYPLNTYYYDVKHQSLYHAVDLIEAEVPAGATIHGVEINPSELPGLDLNNFRVATAFTQDTTLTAFLTTTVAYGPDTLAKSEFVVDSWSRFAMTGVEWDAGDNLVLEFSHDNSSYAYGGGVYLREAGSDRALRGYSWSAGDYPFNDNNLTTSADNKVTDIKLVYVSPVILAPSHLTATPDHQQVTLTWEHSASSDVSHYVISRGTDPSTLAVIDSVSSADSTYINPGLTNGITYYYRVKARTTTGAYSPLSERVSATPAYIGPVWWVSTDGDNANEGTEASPFADLGTALASVSAGDTIMLKPGTYTGAGNRGINPADPITSNIVITSSHGADSTIIDAGSVDRHFILDSGEDSTFEIVGLTFVNGRKTDSYGGSAYIAKYWNGSEYVPSNPTFRDCVFKDNEVTGYYEGGAVFIDDSSPAFVNCQFRSNLAELSGGAVKSQGSEAAPVFSGCSFIHNAAANEPQDYRATYGGAVYIGDGHAEFTDCLFDSNRVQSGDYEGSGGAVYIYGFNNLEPEEPVTFTRCHFRGNSAIPYAYAYGGAVYTQSRARFVNCLFTGNEATGGAGYGDGYGGAIYQYVWSQYNPVTSSYEYGEVSLINSTLVDNRASYQVTGYQGYGGGIYLYGSNQNLTMFNTIIWGNSANQNPSIVDNGASPVAGYNDIEYGDSYSWFNTSNSLVSDPAFSDPPARDYSLSEASFCLGAGTLTFEGLDAPADDILGNPRPDPSDSGSDLGAYESSLAESPYPVPVTGLSAVAASGQVTLSWNSNPEGDIDYYLIYMSLTQGFIPTPEDSLDSSGDTTYQATGLTDGITYYFRVAAVDTQGYHGSPSVEVSGTPSYTGPVWWVATDGSSSNVGSESSPFESIGTALDAAASGDTILVKEGIYSGASNRNISIDKSVVILSLSGPKVTTINAQSQGRHFSISGISRDTPIEISGFKFINGWDSWSGGSIFVDWGSSDENGPAPVITNCIFEDNGAGTEGGAVRVYDAAPRFVDCVFRNNVVSSSRGGAIHVDGNYASPEFNRCKVVGNRISGQDWSQGGGVYIARGTASFEQCEFDSNTVDVDNPDNWAEGGAVYIASGDYWYYEPVRFFGCFFRNNQAESGGPAQGGGLAVHGRADLINCVISGNEAVGGKSNASANASAGGFFAYLVSQFNPQTSQYEYGTVNIVNSTIADNVARDETGNNQSNAGGLLLGTEDFYVTLFNTILWGNQSDGDPLENNLLVGSLNNKNIDFNDVEGSAGTTWVGDNSPDVPPLFAGPDNEDYTLSPFSPVLEMGTASFNDVDAPTVDIGGTGRPLPAGTNPDMGAYEAGPAIILSLPQEDTIVGQDTTLDILLTAMDSQGRPVDDGTSVAWALFPASAYVTIESKDSSTTGGEASVAVAVAANAPRGFEFRVQATVASVRDVMSGSFFVLESVVRAPPAPAGLSISPGEWTQVNSFTLSWTNPSWYYNITGATYRVEGGDPVSVAGENITQLEDIQLPDNGEYTISVWLRDELAHESEDSSSLAVAKWDNLPPGDFSVTAPGSGWTNQIFVRFEWEAAPDITSGVESYELQVGSNVYSVAPDSTGFTLQDTLEEADFVSGLTAYDRAGNSKQASNAPYIQIDRTPVSLSHTPVLSAMLNTDTSPITVSFSDARSGVDEVWLYTRRGGRIPWVVLDMLVTPSRSLPGSEVTTAGLEYYIEAADAAGNLSRVPEDGGFYSIIVTIPGSGQVSSQRWTGGIPSGRTVASYNLLSFPILPDASSPSDILTDDLGEYDDTQWRFFTYRGGDYVEFPDLSTIEAGKAYFLITANPGATIDTDQGTTVATGDSFEIQLETGGWNFIGNPFDFQISLRSITTDQGTSIEGDPNVFAWEGEWQVAPNLRPWYGFVYKSSEATKLFIDPRVGDGSVARQFPVQFQEPPRLGRGEDREWHLEITVEDGIARDGLNQIGIHRKALDGYDRLDAFEPPALPGGMSLSIPHIDWGDHADVYTTDFRSPSTEGHFWDMEVMSGNAGRAARVDMKGIELIPEDFDVFLIDKSLRTAQNLRWKPTYVFDVPRTNTVHHLRVVAGTRDFVESNSAGVDLYPDAYRVSQNFPNPFNARTTIILSLKDNAFVDLTVYNLLGQEVARPVNHELRPAGYYNIIWDGKSRSGEGVSSGVYILTARMSSPAGTVLLRQARKMTLIK